MSEILTNLEFVKDRSGGSVSALYREVANRPNPPSETTLRRWCHGLPPDTNQTDKEQAVDTYGHGFEGYPPSGRSLKSLFAELRAIEAATRHTRRRDEGSTPSGDGPHESTRPSPAKRLFLDVPPRREDFRGRGPDVAAVAAHLRGSSRSAILLHGPPGVGKSQLAAQVVEAVADDYDVIAFVDSRDLVSMRQALDALNRKLDPDHPEFVDESRPEARTLDLLNDTRWLLVFDSAVKPDIVRIFVSAPPTQTPSHGRVLITSSTWTRAAGVKSRPILPLDRSASLEILGLADDPNDAAIEELVKQTLGSPLLLHSVAAVLDQHPDWGATELLREFDGSSLLDLPTPDDHQLSTRNAWMAILRYGQRTHPEAYALFQTICFWAPDVVIPLALLTSPDGNGQWPTDSTDAQQRLNPLFELNLLYSPHGGVAVYEHVAQFARRRAEDRAARLTDLREDLLAQRNESVRHLAQILPFEADAETNVALWRRAAPHAIALADRFDDDESAAAYERVLLLDRVATHFKGRGQLKPAGDLFERAYALAVRHLDDDQAIRLAVVGNLALNTYDLTGKARPAVSAFTALTARYESALSGEKPLRQGRTRIKKSALLEELGDAHQNIGFIGMRSGSHSQAVHQLATALPIYTKLWRTPEEQREHPSVARLWMTLSWAALDLHEWEVATRCSELALDLIKDGPLANGLDHATAVNNRGMADRKDNPQHGVELLDECIRRRTVLFGSDHTSVTLARMNRALLEAEAGGLSEELIVREKALDANRQILEQVDQSEGLQAARPTVLKNVGLAYRLLGELQATIAEHLHSADPDRETLRSKSRHSLGCASEALNTAIRDSPLPRNHPVLVDTRQQLAQVHLAESQGDLALAEMNRAARASGSARLFAETLQIRARARSDPRRRERDQAGASAMLNGPERAKFLRRFGAAAG